MASKLETIIQLIKAGYKAGEINDIMTEAAREKAALGKCGESAVDSVRCRFRL